MNSVFFLYMFQHYQNCFYLGPQLSTGNSVVAPSDTGEWESRNAPGEMCSLTFDMQNECCLCFYKYWR